MQIALFCRKKKHSFLSDFCSRPNFRKLTAKFELLNISCVVYSVFCCIAGVNAKRFVFHCLFACLKFRSYLDLFVESVKSNWDLSVRLHWKFMFVLRNLRRNICDKVMRKRLWPKPIFPHFHTKLMRRTYPILSEILSRWRTTFDSKFGQ